jgi:hypothetical protein
LACCVPELQADGFVFQEDILRYKVDSDCGALKHIKVNLYMLIAVKYIVDESVYYRGLSDCLVSQENDLVLQQWWNAALAEV